MTENDFSINAHSIINAAERENRAAFVVLGGELVTPSAYRSSLETAWNQALNGHSISNNVRADSYGISAPAFACTNYRAQVLSEIPPIITLPDGATSDYCPVPYFMQTYQTLIWNIEASLIIYGVSYLRKVYNQFYYPAALEWLHPDDVDPETDIDGNVISYYIDAVKYDPRHIVEIRTFDPNRDLKGKAEYEVALARITTEQSIVRHAGSFFFNAARPDGMLVSKVRLSPADIRKAEADWKSFKGSKNSWKTFVSSGQWEWIPLTSAPVDLAMVDLSTEVKRDICAIMRVNPALVGFTDVSDPLSAGATMKEIKRNHVEDVALPRFNWIARHLNEQWLHKDFGNGGMYSISADRQSMGILSDVTSDKATTATTLVGGSTGAVIADYDEMRATMGMGARADYIKRNPAEVNTVWLNSGLVLDEYREMLGLKPFGIQNGGDLVRLPNGTLIPYSQLKQVGASMLDQLVNPPAPAPAPSPFGGLGAGTIIHQLPAPPAPAPSPTQSTATDAKLNQLARLIINSKRSGNTPTNSCAVLISFEENPQIKSIQTLLQNQPLGDAAVEWTPCDEYHITLIYADNLRVPTEQSLYSILAQMPPLELTVGKLTLFDKQPDGSRPLVLLMAENDGLKTLRDFQRQVYEAVLATQPDDAALSDYSAPANYTPHITLGYASPGYKPPAFNMPVLIAPESIQFSREVYQITYELEPGESAPELNPVEPPEPNPEPPDNPPPEPPPPLPDPAPARAAIPVDVGIVWTENNFLLMAQRIAADALQTAGVNGVTWYEPRNWKLRLAGFAGTAGEANRVLNEFQPGDSPRLDLTGYKFGIVGNEIMLLCSPADGLSKLSASVTLQLEDSGITPNRSEFTPGIPLGQFDPESDPASAMDLYNALNSVSSGLGIPLVAGAVDLLVNGESRNTWPLRSHSSAQKDELNQWKRKATGRRGADSSFQTSALNGSLVESYVRAALVETDPNDREAVLEVFSRAQKVLTNGFDYLDIPDSPDEFATYWSHFDKLKHDMGAAWLGYMQKAAPTVLDMLATDTNPTSILAPLADYHDELANQWIGTPDEPGELVKLVLAGMAAGNDALTRELNMNPSQRARFVMPWGVGKLKPGEKNVYGETVAGANITIDWNLLNQQAYDFAKSYSYKLIKGLDQTSQERVQKAFTTWLSSGAALPELKAALAPIFNDSQRAGVIAQTEAIRAYNEGAFKRWGDLGIKKAVWRTVADPKVCPICRPMNGQVADFDSGWVHPGGSYVDPYDNQRVNGDPFRGKIYKATAHTGCRCYRRPVVIFEKGNTAGTPAKQEGETVSKTRYAGQPIDAVLKGIEPELEKVRAKMLEVSKDLGEKFGQLRVDRDTAIDKVDELDRQWAAVNKKRIEEKMKDNPDQATIDYLLAQQQQIEAMRSESQKAFVDASIALQELSDKRNKAFHAAITTDAPFNATFDYQKGNRFTDGMKRNAKEAGEFLTSVIDGEQYPDGINTTLKRLNKGGRAHASIDGKSISVTESDETWVHVHEVGHNIEANYPDVHARCVEFLLYRSKGESPRKLSDMYPKSKYDPWEITVKDNFKSAYVGKYYYRKLPKPGETPDHSPENMYATEVLSMGIQYMYEDAADFLNNDPEYFAFILAVMRRYT